MRPLAWITDIHLNFLPPRQVEAFLVELAGLRLDGLLISGDIAESHDVADYLARLDDALEIDIYFVLGNHDFYYGSIREVRESMRQLCRAGRDCIICRSPPPSSWRPARD